MCTHKLHGTVPQCPITGDADFTVIKVKYTQNEAVFRTKSFTRTTRRGWSYRSIPGFPGPPGVPGPRVDPGTAVPAGSVSRWDHWDRSRLCITPGPRGLPGSPGPVGPTGKYHWLLQVSLLSVPCLYVCLSLCLSVFLSVRPSVNRTCTRRH